MARHRRTPAPQSGKAPAALNLGREHSPAFERFPYRVDYDDLTDDETRALIQFLRRTIDEYRYPLSPRLAPLKAILAKLEPPQRPSGPMPPLQARDAPSAAGRRRRRG
jgi:hypothetical protein